MKNVKQIFFIGDIWKNCEFLSLSSEEQEKIINDLEKEEENFKKKTGANSFSCMSTEEYIKRITPEGVTKEFIKEKIKEFIILSENLKKIYCHQNNFFDFVSILNQHFEAKEISVEAVPKELNLADFSEKKLFIFSEMNEAKKIKNLINKGDKTGVINNRLLGYFPEKGIPLSIDLITPHERPLI